MSTPLNPRRDYTALRAPITREQVAEFRRQSKETNRFPTTVPVVPIVIASVVVVFFGATFLGFIAILGTLVFRSGPPEWVLAIGAPAVIVVLALIAGAVTLGVVRGASRRWARRLRQATFAEANGLLFSVRDADPHYPGSIFQVGSARVALEHYLTASGRALDFGNYRYTTGSGDDRTTHDWGFLALRLDRNLPHMVLDAKANNGLFGGSNLPSGFRRDQVLSLEGDFDRYFTLYCPRQYERDALYVFTPDLMALLIDNASAFDVEIVDQWLFVYSAQHFDLADSVTIDRLLRIVDTVGAKTVARTERYSDDRMETRESAGFGVRTAPVDPASPPAPDPYPGIVAPEGRRLRRRVPVIGTVVIVAVVAFQLIRIFSDLW